MRTGGGQPKLSMSRWRPCVGSSATPPKISTYPTWPCPRLLPSAATDTVSTRRTQGNSRAECEAATARRRILGTGSPISLAAEWVLHLGVIRALNGVHRIVRSRGNFTCGVRHSGPAWRLPGSCCSHRRPVARRIRRQLQCRGRPASPLLCRQRRKKPTLQRLPLRRSRARQYDPSTRSRAQRRDDLRPRSQHRWCDGPSTRNRRRHRGDPTTLLS